jgi:signal transduction histidine kinase
MRPSFVYSLIGLSAILAGLVAILVFAMLRFAAAARDAKRHLRESGERAFVSVALEEALQRIKAQERAMSARATASEQLSDQIVSSLTAGLLVVSSTGRIEILNPAGRQLLGLAAGPLPEHYEQIPGIAPLAAVIRGSLASGRPILRRTVEIASPSDATHFGVSVSPLAGGQGTNGAICLFSDLTAVVELEEQLRLKDALARVGELTAGIAHEFRNGLATIHGYGRLLDPAALPPAYRPYIEGIRAETELLGQVVTNFLNFARPEQLVFQPVDLQRLVQRAADDCLHELGARGTIALEGTFATVSGDDVLLRQAFSNLVRNAVEACEGAGVTPAITVVGEVLGEKSLRISVNDNGPGIEPAAASRAFRPFFTTKGRGTGLGLAIVQKVIVSHNGRVTIGASPSGGASLQVVLPVADPTSTT